MIANIAILNYSIVIEMSYKRFTKNKCDYPGYWQGVIEPDQ